MLEQLFLNAPTAMLLINPITNRILIANKQAEALFTLNRRALTQYTVTQFFPDCLDKLHNFTQQVLTEGTAWSSELNIQTANKNVSIGINASKFANNILLSCEDGSVTFERHFKSRIESNYRLGLSQWDTDETVFEQIERQNQLLLTAVGDGIYGVDCEGKTTFVNAAAEAIIGWKKEQLMGKKIHDIIHHTHVNGSHYHVHNCPIYAAFNDGAIHSVDNEVFWSRQGKAIPVEYTSTPLTENGTLIGAVVIFRDITERKRTQDKLLNALKEVDALKHRLEMENAYLQEEINADFNHQYLIGNSNKIKHMMNQIELVAPTDANVLIIGESGTGKELIARAIHEASQRKVRPLIRVNCAAIPAELFESEFFGHVKGAFSGALSDRVGRFELADGATLFLDEVGEIPLQLQSKLLRVLQEQQFERVGESITRNVNVRVIAATNQDLNKLVANNKFREDLYFRLNVFPINSPPLRERLDDLPLLVKHFIDKVCVRLNQPSPQISIAQMQHLLTYNWPGNIRELENIIERQVILSKSNKLNFEFMNKNEKSNVNNLLHTKHSNVLNAQQHKQLERENLIQALKDCRGKIYGEGGAAELLGLKPTTLSSKLKKHVIQRRDFI
ncbi:sigma 54-interacting transcriptional regulator [Psychromonas sp. 14N.309.X.WAT.B.A12]|uniref:sigma 54-interacting transcriptional regulator n=1 Tax=Psychromonas sp. 14N.309.X.WAT.B.A12 TaxID=2998322 RepID=UPI0025B00935|nr:sigma 54-interacting transcriptional regulator [Psychromonas sp. 14N.309.X.WAT.B.A12]MDN2662054.1 sigma 54-interacting transcriptional regulator [Psychromonas sp. 14N.309.X.WAT.B.A12]